MEWRTLESALPAPPEVDFGKYVIFQIGNAHWPILEPPKDVPLP